MGGISNFRAVHSAARILLVCPDCGEKIPESADRLRNLRAYDCTGDGCDYIFELAPGRAANFGGGFIESCKKVYAALHAGFGARLR